MSEPKTDCATCGVSILQSTATQNGGRCKPCATGPKLEDVAGGIEFGTRILLGIVFAAVIGGLGYGIGSMLGTIGGVIIAIPFASLGFLYGCFCVEINAIIRSILPFMLDP